MRETLPPGATRVALARDLAEAELRERGGRLFERLHGEALLLETAARFAASNTPSGSAEAVADNDQGAEPAAIAAVEAERPGPEFDPAARYRLARDAYVAFRPRAIDIRSLKNPGAAHTLPAAFKPFLDSLVQGGDVCASAAAPLTPHSAELLFARLQRAGILEEAGAPRSVPT